MFIPNIQKIRAPLNELLKKDKGWEWTPEYQETFVKIKEVLASEMFLTNYIPALEIITASDASSYGIGSCILHKVPDGFHKTA